MRREILIAMLLTVTLPVVWASDLNEPLDCSDMIISKAGISCGVFLSCTENGVGSESYCDFVANSFPAVVIDNERNLYRVISEPLPDDGACTTLDRFIILQHDGTTETELARIDERCIDPALGWADYITGSSLQSLLFDPVSGQLLFTLRSWCTAPGPGSCAYATYHRVIALQGFTPTLDIFQSFEPATSDVGIRVPQMPEGFPAADWFDTYYGDLNTVGDWSQAQPLECEYPTTIPSVGDYLTVADPLPNPGPGQGRYYVTAVSYQGQRRFGRKARGGVLSGRDPAVLPICE